MKGYCGEGGWISYPSQTAEKLKSYFKQQDFAQGKLLDFGGGYGRYTRLFAQWFQKENVYVVDVDPEMEQYLLQATNNVYIKPPTTTQLPYEDNMFDYVFSSNVVEHIPNAIYHQSLKEIERVLKPNGLLIIGAPNYPAKRFWDMRSAWHNRRDKKLLHYFLFDDPTHINKLSIWEYEKDFKKYFASVHIQPTGLEFIKNEKLRQKLRILGYKYVGFCTKKAG